MFDAIMREDQDGQAGQVREVWHFVKPNNPAHTKWLLDGIQQLAEVIFNLAARQHCLAHRLI